MWGGITSHRWTQLVIVAGNLTSIRHRDKITRPHVLFLQGQRGAVMLQQDNARPHVARVVTDFLRQQNVNTLPWSAVSPDLSPIEHLWDEMERRLPNLPLTLNQLGHDLVQVWNNIPQGYLNHLVSSMRRRCQACVHAHGGQEWD